MINIFLEKIEKKLIFCHNVQNVIQYIGDSMHIINYDIEDTTIFINEDYLDLKSIDDEDLSSVLKELILKLNTIYKLELKGYYKMLIFHHEMLGSFLQLHRIDDLEFSRCLIDLKITIFLDSTIYIKTDDFDLLTKGDIYLHQKFLYQNLSCFSKEELLKIIENVDFVYGEEALEVKSYPKIKKDKCPL